MAQEHEEAEWGVIEVYRAYLDDVNQLRATRTTRDNTYTTIVTLFLGGAAYLASTILLPPQVANLSNPTLDTWLPVLAAAAISYIGIMFCRSWRRLSKDLQDSINLKFSNLEKMEREFALLQRAGAQLMVEERFARHPELRPQQAQKSDEAAAKIPVPPNTRAKGEKSRQGTTVRTREVQNLFSLVFWLLLIFIPGVKVAAVVGTMLVTGFSTHNFSS